MSKIPYPKTKFLKVRCSGCNNVQILFGSAKTIVKCTVCGEDLARPLGGKAKILGEIVETLL